MLNKLVLDKKSDISLYLQIANNIEGLIKKGTLKPGDKLPPERELAASNGISRGTIKKAYEELERRSIIKSVQGSGSFVEGPDSEDVGSRKDKAMKLIEDMLSGLLELGFTYDEIKIYLDIRLRQTDNNERAVKVAAVDCNREALNIFKRQLSNISNLDINSFVLEDIEQGRNSLDILEDFEIILTTTTHYEHLINLFPTLQDKILKCAVSPSRKTVVELARIETDSHIGIFFESRRFAGIVKSHLEGIGVECSKTFIQGDKVKIEQHTLEDFDTIVVPPYYFTNIPRKEMDFVIAFKQRGGRIINFEYLIDRGSLLSIEERIEDIKKRW